LLLFFSMLSRALHSELVIQFLELFFRENKNLIMTQYFWFVLKFRSWPCFEFCETTKQKTGRLLQVLDIFLTSKCTFLTSKCTFLTSKCTFLTSTCTILASKHNLSFGIIFVKFSQNFGEAFLMQYFWYIQKFCNWPCFKFCETTKDGIGCLLQGLNAKLLYYNDKKGFVSDNMLAYYKNGYFLHRFRRDWRIRPSITCWNLKNDRLVEIPTVPKS